MNLKNAVKWISIVALVAGCSSAEVRVMPQEDGTVRVTSRDHDKEGAEEAALDAAKDYCKDKKKEAVFSKDNTKYTGTMNENTRDTVKKASTAAMILSPAVGVGAGAGGGSVLGGAGVVGASMTSGKDYMSELLFKCQ